MATRVSSRLHMSDQCDHVVFLSRDGASSNFFGTLILAKEGEGHAEEIFYSCLKIFKNLGHHVKEVISSPFHPPPTTTHIYPGK